MSEKTPAHSRDPSIPEFLESSGWQLGRSSRQEPHSRSWYKRYPATRCNCNSDKSGMQVAIEEYDFSQWGHGRSYQVKVVGENPDEHWVQLMVYSIPEDRLLSCLDEQVAKMLRAWEATNQPGGSDERRVSEEVP